MQSTAQAVDKRRERNKPPEGRKTNSPPLRFDWHLEHNFMTTPRFLPESEVRAHLRMPDLIDAMERALIEFSAGRVEQPVRSVLRFGGSSLFGLMPPMSPHFPPSAQNS